MVRFALSTCGVLTEVAVLQSSTSMTAMIVGVAAVVLAVGIWWTDLQPQIDRLIGLDL